MVLADTMAIFLVVVGMLICFNAVWLLCRALWGPLVAVSREIHRDGMIKSFFLGLPLTALILVLFGALTSNKAGPWGGLIGIVVMAAYLMFTSIGVAGIADLIGEKLGGSNNQSQPPWRETVRGGAVLVLSFLFPFLGWLLIMPVALIVGCGATMRAMFREWKSSRQERKATGHTGMEQSTKEQAAGAQSPRDHAARDQATKDPASNTASTPTLGDSEILVAERVDTASDAIERRLD
ncbi:MAG: hypothetical protein SGJ27_01600 [Candidatus Melainabacteria bacterium]|nr:hypothetical protein [Candidatus Melainabacteria bacterium]